MIFQEKELFDFIVKKDIEGAMQYIMRFVPDYLYKYYSLTEDSDNELDRKKLETLKNNSNWFDLSSNQNDPLDMKMAYTSNEIYEDATKEQLDLVTRLMEHLSTSMLLCSFLDSDQFNLPMWFAYSNNHKGYCVKYKVSKKQAVWKILYNDYRMPVLSIPLNLLAEMDKSEKLGKETEKLDQYRYIMYLLLNTKHSSWKHENEYRLLYPNDTGTGKIISNQLLGLEPVELFIGLNCLNEHKEKLINICKNNLKCKCYQAYTSRTKILDFQSC